MCIQQVADHAQPDQLLVVESLNVIVSPALVQPRVDIGDWSPSLPVVRLVVHKILGFLFLVEALDGVTPVDGGLQSLQHVGIMINFIF